MNWFKSFWTKLWAEAEVQRGVHNFTPHAQQALALARREARQLNHNFVGTEHLLLALLRLDGSSAVLALHTMGIDLELVRADVMQYVSKGPDQKMVGNIPYTPRVKKALALAIQEMKSLNGTHVGTGHILLGLLREGDGLAGRILKGLNVDIAKTRSAVLQARKSESEGAREDAAPPTSPKPEPVSAKGSDEPLIYKALSNFTPRAQQTLAMARMEADKLNHNFVGTEHLMLGLIRLRQGGAFCALQKMGIDLELVRADIMHQVGAGPEQEKVGTIPYTPRVKHVLKLAASEAVALNDTWVGTEHILLGVLREGDGVAARVLTALNVDLEKARAAVLEVRQSKSAKAKGHVGPPAAPKPLASASAGGEDDPVTPLRAFDPPHPRPSAQRSLPAYTPRAQQAMAMARGEAKKLNHNFVGTEHVSLGLIALGAGRAVFALREIGIDLESVRAEIVKQVGGKGPDQVMVGKIPYTPRMKKVLAFAAGEAMAFNDRWVGTDHILLGLLREGDGLAARVLMGLNVDLERARAAVLEVRRKESGTSSEDVEKGMEAAEEQAVPASSETSPGNLTPRAQRVLLLAQKEAERLQLPFIGTEHVLFGLSMLGAGVATTVLNKIGLELEVIQAEVEKLANRQPAETSGERAHYAPLIKETLLFASQEAKEFDYTYIGTEHLLLALLREPDGGAAEIFKNRNVNTEEVRKEIIKELSPVYIPHVPGRAAEPSQSNPAGNPVVFPSRRRESINLKLRYDIYCVERDGKMVVYRNAQFKGTRTFSGQFDYPMSDFVELEQRDGQTVYVAKSSIVRFCQHGVKPEPEKIE